MADPPCSCHSIASPAMIPDSESMQTSPNGHADAHWNLSHLHMFLLSAEKCSALTTYRRQSTRKEREFNPGAIPVRRAKAPGAGAKEVSTAHIGLMFILAPSPVERTAIRAGLSGISAKLASNLFRSLERNKLFTARRERRDRFRQRGVVQAAHGMLSRVAQFSGRL